MKIRERERFKVVWDDRSSSDKYVQFGIPFFGCMPCVCLRLSTRPVWPAHIDGILRCAIRGHYRICLLRWPAALWLDHPSLFSVFVVHWLAPACPSQCFDRWHAGIRASAPARIWCHEWCAFAWEMSICPIRQRPTATVLPAQKTKQHVWKKVAHLCQWQSKFYASHLSSECVFIFFQEFVNFPRFIPLVKFLGTDA